MSVNLNYKAVEDGFCFQKDDRVLVLAFTGGNAENKTMENFIVRHFSDRRIDDFVRITVGTDEETKILIKTIKNILESK